MDGDEGRKLNKPKRPPSEQAKDLELRFANHPLKLQVLQRYGIENYFSQHACEAVLGRNLSAFFPIPDSKKIEEHLREPQPWRQRLSNFLRRRKPPSFYRKNLNQQIAAHLTFADITGTDLADIIHDSKPRARDHSPRPSRPPPNEVHNAAEAARQY